MTDTLLTQEGGASPLPSRGVELPSPKYVEDGGWRDSANCRHEGSEVFFAEGGKGGDPRRSVIHREHAISICTACDVRLQCLNFAIRNEERWGIWGGVNLSKMTGAERNALAKKVQELSS